MGIVSADGNENLAGFEKVEQTPGRRGKTAVMGQLEKRCVVEREIFHELPDPIGRQVAGQQEAVVPVPAIKSEAAVVDVGPLLIGSKYPWIFIRRWLAAAPTPGKDDGGYGPFPDNLAQRLGEFRRVHSRPELSYRKMTQDVYQPQIMIGMGMGQDHRFELMDAEARQGRSNNSFTNVEV